MKILKKISIAAFLAVLAFSHGSTMAAPDISLKDVNDKTHNLSEFIGKGKWTVLNLWGPGCPPCLEEMPDLVLFHEKHKDDDAIVVGIAIDFPSYGYADKQKVADFLDEYLIDFPVLLSDSHVTEKLGMGVLQGLPTTYMFAPDGEMVGMQVGGITAKILEDFIRKKSSIVKTKKQDRATNQE